MSGQDKAGTGNKRPFSWGWYPGGQRPLVTNLDEFGEDVSIVIYEHRIHPITAVQCSAVQCSAVWRHIAGIKYLRAGA